MATRRSSEAPKTATATPGRRPVPQSESESIGAYWTSKDLVMELFAPELSVTVNTAT